MIWNIYMLERDFSSTVSQFGLMDSRKEDGKHQDHPVLPANLHIPEKLCGILPLKTHSAKRDVSVSTMITFRKKKSDVRDCR